MKTIVLAAPGGALAMLPLPMEARQLRSNGRTKAIPKGECYEGFDFGNGLSRTSNHNKLDRPLSAEVV
jgi:hypothetical protein